MAIGLTRSLNLSEKELNLSEALQKLYAPGIEDDIDLFSLSSQIKSTIVSGKEDDGTENADIAQILGLRNENLKAPDGSVLKRTKFQSIVDLYSVGDKVYFSVFGLTPNSGTDVVNPVYSNNGSIPAIKVLSNGNGFYFNKPATSTGGGGVQRLTEDTLAIENVPLKGKISRSENARATVTFKIDSSTVFNTSNVATWKLSGTSVVHNVGSPISIGSTSNTLQVNADGTWVYTSPNAELYNAGITIDVTYVAYQGTSETATYTLIEPLQTAAPAQGSIDLAPQGAPEYLTKWTGFYTRRYYVDSVILTTPGSGYLIGEEVEILEGSTVEDDGTGAVCVLVRQEGVEYFGKEPIVLTDQYYYEVRDASQNGMYLFDTVLNKYIFLNTEKDFDEFQSSPREIKILRGDEIYVDNILQLRFAQSRINIDNYGDSFRVGDSITGEIYSLTNSAAQLRTDSYKSIQNTKAPTSVTSTDNTLGFEYNRIIGDNLAVYQRLIMRDQDWVLGTNAGSANEVTGAKLKGSVSMPEFTLADPAIRVPGLFIKVGTVYKRAYSTSDKPFFQANQAGTGAINPDIDSAEQTYSLYAANQDANSEWYSYNTTLSKFAQRVSLTGHGSAGTPANNGKNGAFYFHRNTPFSVTSVSSQGKTFYEIPLFTYVG